MAVDTRNRASLPAECRAAWLSSRHLLVSVRVPGADDVSGVPDGADEGRVRVLPGAPDGQLLMVWQDPDAMRLPPPRFLLRAGDGDLLLTRRSIRASECDISGLLLAGPAGACQEGRNAILESLGDLMRETADGRAAGQLAQSLYRCRQLLRPRLPRPASGISDPVHVDAVLKVDDRRFDVTGWLSPEVANRVELVAVSPEGARARLTGLHRFPRPDTDQRRLRDVPESARSGFLSTVELEHPSCLQEGWLVEATQDARHPSEIGVPLIQDAFEVQQHLLELLLTAPEGRTDRIVLHIQPSLLALQSRLRNSLTHVEPESFGDVPEGPRTSLIVRLGSHVDTMEHLLAQIVHTTGNGDVDVLFVSEGARCGAEARHAAQALYPLFRVPFRLLALPVHAGPAASLDWAAHQANGEVLLVQAPTVLPESPEWIPELLRFLDSAPADSVVSPGILDPAGHSLEGPVSQAPDGSGPDGDAADGGWRAFGGVSERCFVVSREAYRRVGGLIGVYTTTAFETIDLCTRLKEDGSETFRCPTVDVVHVGEDGDDVLDPALWRQEIRLWSHLHPDGIAHPQPSTA